MEEKSKVPIPGPQATIRQMLTDRKAWTDGVITPLLFLTISGFWGVRLAALAAASWGMGLGLYRLMRKQKITYAVSGLVGLGIALSIALATGRASNYFLPNVIFGFLYGTAGLISVLVGRPISAVLVRLVEGKPAGWYRLPQVKRAHVVITMVWSTVFLVRASVRALLIARDSEFGLALTTVTLGLPTTALLVAGSWAFLRRRLRGLSIPSEHTS